MVIFFLRREPDVDNIVPVIYRMAKDKACDLIVLCVNPYFDLNDYRLSFLKEQYNIPVYHVHEYYYPTIFHKLAGYFILNAVTRKSKKEHSSSLKENELSRGKESNSNFLNVIKNFLSKAIYAIINRVSKTLFLSKRFFFTERWAESFLKHINPSALVFDYVHSDMPIINVMLTASKKLGINSIFLPHGIPLFTEPVMKDRIGGRGPVFAPIVASNPDAIVIPHRHVVSSFIQHGIDMTKLHILGSARYCREWIDVCHAITLQKDCHLQSEKNKLKVLYLERGNDRYGDRKNLVRETFMKISKLDFVHFIIKPHPRSNKMYFDNLPHSIDIAYNVDSINLCKWADIVMCLVSSIALEVLIQNKVLIYPKYFDDTPILIEEMKACWTVNNYKELENAFIKIKENPSHRSYSQEDVEKFLVEVVYGGKRNRDVLGDYGKLILQKS